MSILIKDMKMPKTCAYCRFIYADPNIEYEQPDGTKMVGGCCCCFTGNVIWNTKCDDDCPLVEVPPHGRLIDADKAKEHMDYVCVAGGWLEPVTKAVNEYVKKHIDAEPTVIEAEGGA